MVEQEHTFALYLRNINDNTIVWQDTFRTDRDYVAGILAIGLIWTTNPQLQWHLIEDGVDIQPKNFIRGSYLIYSEIPEALITKFPPLKDKLSWWVRSFTAVNTYNLYQFKNYDFIEGILDITEKFSIDFRDYTYLSPFKSETDEDLNVMIEGFDMRPFYENITFNDRLAPVTPYYTGNPENDFIPLADDQYYEGNYQTTAD